MSMTTARAGRLVASVIWDDLVGRGRGVCRLLKHGGAGRAISSMARCKASKAQLTPTEQKVSSEGKVTSRTVQNQNTHLSPSLCLSRTDTRIASGSVITICQALSQHAPLHDVVFLACSPPVRGLM